MNERALTPDESRAFFSELHKLLDKYGVSLDAEEHVHGYLHYPPTIYVCDSRGNELLNTEFIE